jgi:cytochrome c biogenesis protein CcmG/thiol:disulfide interchange protein DsbE
MGSGEHPINTLGERAQARDKDPIAINRPGVSGWVRALIFAAVFALLGLVGWGLARAQAGPRSAGRAPNFSLNTFDGETVTLADLRGQVVVVNFWASWCPPCRDEAAYLEETWRGYRERGVMFLGVDYVDTEPEARAYLAEFDITYPNGPDTGTRISQAFRIQGVPETYFIGKDGTLRGLKVGPLAPPELEQWLEPLLAEE